MPEMLKILKIMLGKPDGDPEDYSDDVLGAYLDLAGQKILGRLYPFGIPEGAGVPERYQSLQCEIACYMLNKRGAEGQTSHSENGISRQYESGSVPESMLFEIVPFVGV